MNILFLINYAGNGGSEKYVEVLINEYSKLGHKCFCAFNEEGLLSEKIRKNNIPYLKLDLSKDSVNTAAREIAQYCKEHSIDVIHAQFPRENIIAIKSLKFYKVPKVVFTSHLSIKQGAKWKILNSIYTRKNHGVIALYDGAIDLLVSNGIPRNKIKLVYNGVQTQSEYADNSVKPFTMCTMGRFSDEKGFDFLIDALKEFKERVSSKYICYMLGDGDLFDHIKTRVEELGLEKNVLLEGYTNDASAYLKKSNIYVCSSKTEALSFSILEAMSYGLPVIATDVGGNSILIKQDGLSGTLIKYGDCNKFVDAIEAYMNNHILWQHASTNAIEKIYKKYSLEKLAENTLKVYE